MKLCGEKMKDVSIWRLNLAKERAFSAFMCLKRGNNVHRFLIDKPFLGANLKEPKQNKCLIIKYKMNFYLLAFIMLIYVFN